VSHNSTHWEIDYAATAICCVLFAAMYFAHKYQPEFFDVIYRAALVIIVVWWLAVLAHVILFGKAS